MRHGWTADIADFAKYGLLKRLADSDLRLGVFWYLTNHAAPRKPLVSYLKQPDKYQQCDPVLFEELRNLYDARRDALTVYDIERGGILADTTVFHSAPLTTSSVPRAARRSTRTKWFQDGCDLTGQCDVIFLDPDTGVLPLNRRSENKRGEEYATLDEILELCGRGQSVICVQFGAPGNYEREPVLARRRLSNLASALESKGLPKPWGLWWRDGHKVGLLVSPSPRHNELLGNRREAILADAAWNKRVVAL